MRFDSSIYLWLLAIIPIMTLLMVWAEWQRSRMLRRIGDKDMVMALLPDASAKRRWIKFILTQLIIATVIIMVARPQMGVKTSHEKRNGIEAIIALDISNSMMAQDVIPSRLQKSKMLIESLIDNFNKDKVGMIVFAGDAFVQLPITSDYVSAKMFLQNIDPSLIRTQGTDISEAINLAVRSFTQQKNIGKAIIVITDGEDHEGGAAEAARAAREKGYKVFILGVGKSSGAPIPVADGGYMKDNSGSTVMTALNEQMCREIAEAGSGTYIHVDNTSSAQERLNEELSKMQRGDIDTVIYSEYDEQFQIFAMLALILIIIEVCISEVINPYFRKLRLFSRRTAVMLLVTTCTLTISAQNTRQFIRSGNRDFRSGMESAPSKAEVKYRKALSASQANPQAMYNLGCALMAQKNDSVAMEMFGNAAKIETSKVRRAMCYHNMGVILQSHRQYDQAIEQYKQALRLKPQDNETRYNLVLCQRLRKNNPQNNKGNSGGKGKGGDDNKDKKKDQKDNNGKNNESQGNDNSQDKQQQQQEGQMSKENAEQLLNAAILEENATQQRMKKAMTLPQRRSLQKKW